MRNIIPVIFVAATLLVGCKTSTQASKSAAASASAAAATPAPAPVPVGPNTPEQTLAENNKLGNLAGAFLGVLYIAALKRP
jgi:hypothetical protein